MSDCHCWAGLDFQAQIVGADNFPQGSAGVVVAILVALAGLWATGSLGPVYRWLVVLRSHSISRAVGSQTARYYCRSLELISRVFMNHVLFRRAMDFS
jgi:hypothetical protein